MARESNGADSRNQGWSPCPAGELTRLGNKVRSRRQRRVFLQSAAAAGAAGLGGLAWWLAVPGEPPLGGLNCTQVQELAKPYAAGTLGEEMRKKVRQHLAECPQCGPRFKAMGLAV